MASAEGTRRFLQRAVERGLLHSSNVRQLGPSLSCSAIGFGSYRVGGGEHEPAHAAAIRSALRAGVNLIDTSTHYSAGSKGNDAPVALHGASERLVGRVVAEALEAGEAARDELVICTKVGHVPRGAATPPGAVAVGGASQRGEGNVSDDWHSMDPAFVADEVLASKERLGLAPDFVLLHNPDFLLAARLLEKVPIADAWDEMYETLLKSFRQLEKLCNEGAIASGYGVSSNFLSCMFSTTGRSNVYEALALDRVVEVAAAAARLEGVGEHRFRIAQLPLNAFESGAVLGRGAVVPEAAEGDCLLAPKLGVSVVTNRPINSLPIPGVGHGDWGRGGASHLPLRDEKPMGTMQSLLKRVLVEALQIEADSAPSLQCLALRLSASAPGVACSLTGARRESYVADVSEVLRSAPFSEEQVRRAMLAVRSAAEELGCQKRGLW
eukprot:gb/GFBE01054612.1/.p1 GENE.gb/GFBE01054612.1/~~gb/GFBE01054612.1/.p1  ORF type:complete len:439 (+),score=84.49 gb/GFBE01054612.1/:1-1317(+)